MYVPVEESTYLACVRSRDWPWNGRAPWILPRLVPTTNNNSKRHQNTSKIYVIKCLYSYPCDIYFTPSPKLVPTGWVEHLPRIDLVVSLCPNKWWLTPSFTLPNVPIKVISDLFSYWEVIMFSLCIHSCVNADIYIYTYKHKHVYM